ncbi:MAG: DUF1573 domain-containing protein [Bacteroidetes bacterium]|nr:DUF1573 domain-containing protein [Bacteroidota bacterium]
MKYIILFSVFMLASFTMFAQNTDDGTVTGAKPSKAVIEWDKTTHDFGEIPQGIPVNIDFELSNESLQPAVINNVKTSCGCTVPQYPKEPIKPGSKAKIKVEFNAKAVGMFSKSISVYMNSETDPIMLYIKGKVLPPSEETK